MMTKIILKNYEEISVKTSTQHHTTDALNGAYLGIDSQVTFANESENLVDRPRSDSQHTPRILKCFKFRINEALVELQNISAPLFLYLYKE